jgi:hypothetical protein
MCCPPSPSLPLLRGVGGPVRPRADTVRRASPAAGADGAVRFLDDFASAEDSYKVRRASDPSRHTAQISGLLRRSDKGPAPVIHTGRGPGRTIRPTEAGR